MNMYGWSTWQAEGRPWRWSAGWHEEGHPKVFVTVPEGEDEATILAVIAMALNNYYGKE